MKVIDLLNQGKPTLSFEFFPPKTEEQEEHLVQVIGQLKKFSPDYVSVTYGALGANSAKAFRWVRDIKDRFALTPVAHLTCVSASRDELNQKVKELVAMGVENILALRGDLPEGQQGVNLPVSGCAHACELVAFIKELYPSLCLGVAGYPEKHPEAPDLVTDIGHLKKKVAAGADYIVTQLFFDNQHYFDFVAKCRKAGITVPIVPGLMPITSYKLLHKMIAICGAKIPDDLFEELEQNQHNPAAVLEIGLKQAVKQCQQLKARQVPGLHFFVMNQAGPISKILKRI